MADDIGTIEPGKLADFVVIDGDPLSDISLVLTAVVGVVGARIQRLHAMG